MFGLNTPKAPDVASTETAATPPPGNRSGGTAPSGLGDAGQRLADDLARKHGAGPENLDGDSRGPAPTAAQPGSDDGVQAIDPATVREMVALGFAAIDETLRNSFAQSWFKLTGDRDFAQGQADFYAAKPGQVRAVATFAALCAQKYQTSMEYLPEIGLGVAVGSYAINWRIGFNKLNQALRIKADAEKPAATADAPSPPAD